MFVIPGEHDSNPQQPLLTPRERGEEQWQLLAAGQQIWLFVIELARPPTGENKRMHAKNSRRPSVTRAFAAAHSEARRVAGFALLH